MDHNDQSYIQTGQKPMKDEFPSNLSQSISDSLYGSKIMCWNMFFSISLTQISLYFVIYKLYYNMPSCVAETLFLNYISLQLKLSDISVNWCQKFKKIEICGQIY